MFHTAKAFDTGAPAITVTATPERLGAIVHEQMLAISAEGFSDFDVRWNGFALTIEARNDDKILRRDFSAAGSLSLERITESGITVERFFGADGIEPLRENIFANSDDR